MLGSMISKIRKDKDITKVELSKRTKINIGHLTHIEKGERNPSHKALKKICEALKVPYQNMLHMYDRVVTEDEIRYKMLNHISYNKVIAVNSINDFIDCPYEISRASMALKIPDNSMEPKLKKDNYAFLELNAPLINRDFGLFKYNDEILIRRFIIRQDKLILRADNKEYAEIELSEDDNFTIIGRIIPNSK